MTRHFYRVLKAGAPVEAALVMSRDMAEEIAGAENELAPHIFGEKADWSVGEVSWDESESFWIEAKEDGGFEANEFGKKTWVEARFGRWNLLADGGIVLDLPNGTPYGISVSRLQSDPHIADHICGKDAEEFDLGGFARLILYLVKRGRNVSRCVVTDCKGNEL